MGKGVPMAEVRPVTALRRALSCDDSERRATVLDAFSAARRRFAVGERIDMQGLAYALGVNRVTLYRWVGSREQLITEVLWAVTRKSFDGYRAVHTGGPRAAVALTAFVRDVNAHPGMRQLLRDEPALALGLLTSTSGEYEQRYLGLIRGLIEEDRADGLVSSEIPLEDLAYTAARITESYIHTRVLIGEEPDARRAEVVLRVLLR